MSKQNKSQPDVPAAEGAIDDEQLESVSGGLGYKAPEVRLPIENSTFPVETPTCTYPVNPIDLDVIQ